MIKEHTYQDRTIHYKLTFKKRKSLGIYVDVYGNIELRVPRETPEKQIVELIENKWDWINRKSDESKEKTQGFKEKNYEDGEHFLYLGQEYPIVVSEDAGYGKGRVSFDGEVLKIDVAVRDEAQLKKLMTRFYKQQCKKLVEARIKVYQTNFKVKPRKISISSNKKTWGTCNNLREMTFNWKLAMAPLTVIDYIVVHEMCHMVHLNHDRSFWRLVGKIMPDYEAKEAWLSASHWKMVV